MSDQLNSNRFLLAYNSIDRFMRDKLKQDDGVSHSHIIDLMAKSSSIIRRYKSELEQYAKLRNAIVHNHYRDADPIAEPHEIIVSDYERIASVLLNPPRALDKIAVKNILTAKPSDHVFEVMKDMNEKNITHVPIIHEDKMIGIFSESTIFFSFIENQYVLLDEKTKMSELKDVISIEYQKSDCFEFTESSATVFDVEEIFKEGFKQDKRIAVVFITQRGNQNEKLLGLITPWDLQKYSS